MEGEPIIDVKVEPKSAVDADRLAAALRAMAAQDESFAVWSDAESGETIISGQSELHLDMIVHRLQREFAVAINIGAPQVAYREAITRPVEHDYTHKRQLGGAGQFARIKFRIEPRDTGMGFAFASDVPVGNVPEPFVAAVRKGVETVMSAGPAIGYPIVDVKFTLTDGAYHNVDSSADVFEIAARQGFKEAIEKAQPIILEPIMSIKVVAPEDFVGDVIGDLNSRRGQIRGAEARGADQAIEAMVPLATMFGYVTSLRAMSKGRATFSMALSHYERVPDTLRDPDPDGRFPPAAAMRLRA